MGIENLTNGVLIGDLVKQISFLTTLFQAIGGLIIFYIIFNIIINRKKKKQLEKINENLKEIKRLLSKGRKK